VIAFLAAAFAAMNVVGGYVVTGRMLKMFRRRPAVQPGTAVQGGSGPDAITAASNGSAPGSATAAANGSSRSGQTA
jgi:H+-translocating NAD(P) transhydrogenase subunit alpha